jgi:uroporphyrinogen-III synthase
MSSLTSAHPPLRVAVTRAAGKAESLTARLLAAGAEVQEIPLTRIERLPVAPLHAALRALGDTRWILLTSVNAVEVLADAVAATGTDQAIADCYFAVVGEVTAQAAEAQGWRADVVPAQFKAEALLDAFASRTDVVGTRALYPCAAGARDVLPDGLRALGAEVAVMPCYESVPDPEGQRLLGTLLAEHALDLVTVAAPSAVDALADAVAPELAGRVALASIGPVTSKAARQAGFRVAVEANPYTSEGLVRQIVAWRARTA